TAAGAASSVAMRLSRSESLAGASPILPERSASWVLSAARSVPRLLAEPELASSAATRFSRAPAPSVDWYALWASPSTTSAMPARLGTTQPRWLTADDATLSAIHPPGLRGRSGQITRWARREGQVRPSGGACIVLSRRWAGSGRADLGGDLR